MSRSIEETLDNGPPNHWARNNPARRLHANPHLSLLERLVKVGDQIVGILYAD